jgi:hypothetical protein
VGYSINKTKAAFDAQAVVVGYHGHQRSRLR